MREGSGPGWIPGRWAFAALLCVALATAARAAPPPASCLVPVTGSPSCTAGDAAAAPGSAIASNGPGLHVGNPIEVASGNKYQRESDYLAFGTGLAFVRHYNSLLADEDLGLGPGWRHTYHVSLAAIEGGGLRLTQSDGRVLDFAPVPGTAEPEVHVGEEPENGLIAHEGGLSSWYLPDGRRLDFAGPRLVRLDWGDARGALDLEYRNGRVTRVVDRIGRALELDYVAQSASLPTYGEAGARYRPPGAIDSLVLPDGARIRFEYRPERPLEAVVHPDGARVDYGYTDVGWLPPLLAERRVSPAGTGPEDATVTRWRYDDDGLAIGVEGAVGLDIERVPVGPHAGTATVRWHDGRTEAMSWEADGRVLASDGSVASSRARRASPREPARERDELDALADAALSSLRVAPYEDGSTLLATLPLNGRSEPLWMRSDRHGNLELLQLGPTDLEAVLAYGAVGDLPACGTDRPDAAEIVGRLSALADGGSPCSTDVLAAFALEAALERRQRVTATGTVLDSSTVPSTDFDPPLELRRGRRPGAAPPGPPKVVKGPEPSPCDMPPGKDCPALAEDHEMALLSACAYDSGPCASDWRRVDPAEVGLADIDFHDDGFDAVLYHDAATGRYTLAFRGTDGVGDDWGGTNFAQGRGKPTRQYGLAYELAGELERALPGANLSFTGHSLGGGLATFAALSIRAQATVFNAAALHPKTAARESLEQEYADADQYIDLVTIYDDPITSMNRRMHNWGSFGSRFTPGRHTVLANPSDEWVERNYSDGGPIDTPLARHSMAAVIEQIEILLNKHCGGVP